MVLFTVSIMSASDEAMDRLRGYLIMEFADLHSAAGETGHTIVVDFKIDGTRKLITCSADTQYFCSSQDGPLALRRAAAAFANYVLDEFEPRLLRAVIRKQFHYEREEEIDELIRYCETILNGSADSVGGAEADEEMVRKDRERRKSKVENELELFLEQGAHLNLDGFVTFRLASYWEELREIAAYAVDEYIMDKQYQEFISLLKYFVRMQEIKLPVVHVLHKGGSDFALYDEQHRLLDDAPGDRIVAEMLESEMNIEDMIVSTLITASPQQIIIHTRQPELQVMRTLEMIFEQRVSLCSQCGYCKDHFRDSKQPASAVNPKPAGIGHLRT